MSLTNIGSSKRKLETNGAQLENRKRIREFGGRQCLRCKSQGSIDDSNGLVCRHRTRYERPHEELLKASPLADVGIRSRQSFFNLWQNVEHLAIRAITAVQNLSGLDEDHDLWFESGIYFTDDQSHIAAQIDTALSNPTHLTPPHLATIQRIKNIFSAHSVPADWTNNPILHLQHPGLTTFSNLASTFDSQLAALESSPLFNACALLLLFRFMHTWLHTYLFSYEEVAQYDLTDYTDDLVGEIKRMEAALAATWLAVFGDEHRYKYTCELECARCLGLVRVECYKGGGVRCRDCGNVILEVTPGYMRVWAEWCLRFTGRRNEELENIRFYYEP